MVSIKLGDIVNLDVVLDTISKAFLGGDSVRKGVFMIISE